LAVYIAKYTITRTMTPLEAMIQSDRPWPIDWCCVRGYGGPCFTLYGIHLPKEIAFGFQFEVKPFPALTKLSRRATPDITLRPRES
jgi:hypothetical protein